MARPLPRCDGGPAVPDETTLAKALWALFGGAVAWLGQHAWKLIFFRSAKRQETAAATAAEVDVAAKLAVLASNIGQEYDRFRDSVEARFTKIQAEMDKLREEREECEARSAAQAIEIERAKADAKSAKEEARIVGERYDVIEGQLIEITRKAGERGYTDIFGVALILLMLGAVAHVTLAGMAMKPTHPPPVAVLPASKR